MSSMVASALSIYSNLQGKDRQGFASSPSQIPASISPSKDPITPHRPASSNVSKTSDDPSAPRRSKITTTEKDTS